MRYIFSKCTGVGSMCFCRWLYWGRYVPSAHSKALSTDREEGTGTSHNKERKEWRFFYVESKLKSNSISLNISIKNYNECMKAF